MSTDGLPAKPGRLPKRDWFKSLLSRLAGAPVAPPKDSALTSLLPLPRIVRLEDLAKSTQLWVSILWHAMQRTGKGYRRYSLGCVPPEGASRWRGSAGPTS